jgi:subtilisin family serine protease
MRPRILPIAIILAFARLAPAADIPAPDDRARFISLASGAIDVTQPPEIPDSLAAGYVLVKFPGPVTAAQRQALEKAAQRVYTYLPHDAFLVKAGPGLADPGARAALGASWIGPFRPASKIAPAVSAVSATRTDARPGEAPLRIVMLHVYPDADLHAVRAAVQGAGAARIVGAAASPFFSRIRLLATDAEIEALRDALARIPEVFWIGLEGRLSLVNDTTIWVGQSGVSGGQTTPAFSHGIHGEGQVVGIIDTGLDPDMCYFRDPALGLPPRNECNGGVTVNASQRKVLAVDFLWTNECAGGIGNGEWDTNGHGTHVAGTVAGDNFANVIGHDPGDGMAPGAKLVIQDGGYQVDNCADLPALGCPVVDLNPLFQQAYTQGARLHTNSYGDQENTFPQNNYTAASQDVDEFMWNHPDFQIFFAAGNSGPGTGSVGSPSTAKNAISVGATRHGTLAEAMAGFSSCGPTDDNRIKPDLTIPGENVVSADADGSVVTNNCGTTSLSGTSMASPAAAGLGALARQYFTDGFYPSGAATPADAFTPTAALVKATLLSSAQSMTGVAQPIPSNCQGWGRILLDNALFFPGDARRLWVEDDTTGFPLGSSGETRSYQFTVTSSSVPLKASLVWTDFPSTPAASPHLNNDLDLEVVGPGGTFLGNIWSGGQSTTGGSPDRRNTVEQVLRLAPSPGAYTVTVRSFTVPNGPQPFALVVTGDIVPQVPVELLTFEVK